MRASSLSSALLPVGLLLSVLFPACSGEEPEPDPTQVVVVDQDGDGLEAGDCDDTDPAVGSLYADRDGDGHGAGPLDCDGGTVASADDCNDGDASSYPGADERCDEIDNDCDGEADDGVEQTSWLDADGDGWGDSSRKFTACEPPPGYVERDGDCDDSDPLSSPDGEERCDEADNDCDDAIDEEAEGLWYVDADGDGHGEGAAVPVEGCTPPEGYSDLADDCDDSRAASFPGAEEQCDERDNDCDGEIDERVRSSWYPDGDGDGYGADDGDVAACEPPEGYVAEAGDCDDGDAGSSPASDEVCDTADNDCDGEVDEELELSTWYPDADTDGYGDPEAGLEACAAPEGYLAEAGDCDDRNQRIHPGAAEYCDLEDNDCDDKVDNGYEAAPAYEDADGDGWGDSSRAVILCFEPEGYANRGGDCDDTDPSINPSIEDDEVDAVDADCDGAVNHVERYAGVGIFGGDGGPAVDASLYFPTGMARGQDGSLYIADYFNHRIRRIDPTGTITTIAGNGLPGFAGDGGPAIAARLYYPAAVLVDEDGVVYFTDSSNQRIRSIDEAGVISTVAGGGQDLNDGVQALQARLNAPNGLAWDDTGGILFVDTNSHRVRRLSAEGTITTVAGNGNSGSSGDGGQATQARLRNPIAVARDATGQLFIADRDNHRIRRVDTKGVITTVAGSSSAGASGDGGQATAAQLNSPQGVAVAADGTLYIGDHNNHRVRRVTPNGTISTWAGDGNAGFGGDGGVATAARLNTPGALLLEPDGALLVADRSNHRIRRIDPEGVISTRAGNGSRGFGGDGGEADRALIDTPRSLAMDRDGRLLIADANNFRVRRIEEDGRITTMAGNGSNSFSGDGGAATGAGLADVSGLAVDASGNVYVSDVSTHRVRRITPGGIISTVAGNGTAGFSGDGGAATAASLSYPTGVAVDLTGNLFIADTSNARVRKVDTKGVITTVAGSSSTGFAGDGGPATAARLNAPVAVVVDDAEVLYIADSENHRVRRVGTDNRISTFAGSGTAGFAGDGGAATAAQLNLPWGLAVDGAGNLFIADLANNRVRRVDGEGLISTVVGDGLERCDGEAGPALSISVNHPAGLVVDPSGHLFVADTLNHRVMHILP